MYDVTSDVKLRQMSIFEYNKLCLHLQPLWDFVQDWDSQVYELAYYLNENNANNDSDENVHVTSDPFLQALLTALHSSTRQ